MPLLPTICGPSNEELFASMGDPGTRWSGQKEAERGRNSYTPEPNPNIDKGDKQGLFQMLTVRANLVPRKVASPHLRRGEKMEGSSWGWAPHCRELREELSGEKAGPIQVSVLKSPWWRNLVTKSPIEYSQEKHILGWIAPRLPLACEQAECSPAGTDVDLLSVSPLL